MKLDVIKLDGGAAGSVDLDGQDTVRGQLFDQEDLSSERHRRRTPRRTFCTDLPFGWYLQGSNPS